MMDEECFFIWVKHVVEFFFKSNKYYMPTAIMATCEKDRQSRYHFFSF